MFSFIVWASSSWIKSLSFASARSKQGVWIVLSRTQRMDATVIKLLLFDQVFVPPSGPLLGPLQYKRHYICNSMKAQSSLFWPLLASITFFDQQSCSIPWVQRLCLIKFDVLNKPWEKLWELGVNAFTSPIFSILFWDQRRIVPLCPYRCVIWFEEKASASIL